MDKVLQIIMLILCSPFLLLKWLYEKVTGKYSNWQ